MKYPNVTLGRVEAVWNKLGGEEGVNRFLRGEFVVSERICSWREKEDVIYFSVTSDGATGEQWILRLKEKGFCVPDYTESVLRSLDFKPTSGVTTEVAVLKGISFEDRDRTTRNIRVEAERRGLMRPNAEVACLIREKFTDEDIRAMGFWWIVVMHEPFRVSCVFSGLLAADRIGGTGQFRAYNDMSDEAWHRYGGFAFAVSQA